MALINMKCDNCGAPLKAEGSAYVCDYCGAVYARIADPDACLTGSVTIEEFKQELEKSARTFSVSFDDAASDSYTDNELSRDRLRLAGELLIEARCLNDPGYTPSEDLEYLLACRDAEMTVTGKNADRSEILRNISPVIAERIRRSDREKGKRNAVIWSLIIRPAAVVIALAAIILIWKFIESVFLKIFSRRLQNAVPRNAVQLFSHPATSPCGIPYSLVVPSERRAP